MNDAKPIQIDVDEWWFKGCFIQRQIHPNLHPYHVFKDTKNQEAVGTCITFTGAKRLCCLNEVKDYEQGYEVFI